MKRLSSLLFAALSVLTAGADSSSALDRRWVHFLYDFRKDAQVVTMTNLVATAKDHGYTGVILASSCGLGMLHRWDDARRERLMTVKRACDEAGLEIAVGVWSIGYAKECFFPIDPNLSAASPVFDTRYRVAGGKCEHMQTPARELLPSPGKVHSPGRAGDVGGRLVSVNPHRSYRLTIRARAPKIKYDKWPIGVSVRRADAKKDYIETRAFYIKTDGTEHTFTLHFPSLAEKELHIICNGYNRTFPNYAEILSMKLEEIPPLVAIRRHGTPVTVRNARTGFVYEEGRDFAPVPRAKTVWPGPWVKGADRFAIVPLKGGRMQNGDELSVDCYCPFPTWGKWTSACMAAPELEPIMEASAAEIARTLNPRLWFLSYDEVRAGGGCRDCLKIGDMAHIFAAFVKKSMRVIRRHSPGAEFMVWNDMVDPFYMNDNGENAGLYSTMKGVWDLLPKDIGIGYWTYGTREKGMKFFSDRGHKILACAYYDEKELKRSVEWTDLALRTPGTVGIVYCTWGDNWKLLGAFGDMVKRKAEGVGADPSAYSVPILGDTHFDETEWGTYHVGWRARDERDAAGRKREFARNADMWRFRLPSLIASAAACSRPGDAFLLQVGDLVQGDCPDSATQTRLFTDAVAACRKGFGSLPFVSVAGNHDVRNGGRSPYDEFFPRFHSKELGRRIESNTFSFRQGPDAWIFVDFMDPDRRRLFEALDACADARYTFVVSHSPVTPTDNWGFFWFLFGREEDTADRRRLRELLMRRRAIILCGHTHFTELNEWRTDAGVMTQFSANSVWRSQELAKPRLLTDDPASWGKLWVEKNATDDPVEHDGSYSTRTRAESLALLAEYAPGLVRYEKYAAAGHYRLEVSDDGVRVLFYGGDSRTPTKTFVLR